MTDDGPIPDDADAESVGLVDRLEARIAQALAASDAVAFVHAGTDHDPAVRYCRLAFEGDSTPERGRCHNVTAVAFDGDEWLSATVDPGSSHPAETVVGRLADRLGPGTILTPARLPHDAALYLEGAGFDLASTDALERARADKTDGEVARIESAQTAAGAGIRRAATLLADATFGDGRLAVGGEVVTPRRLRTAVDEAIVTAGAFPAGNTVVNPDPGHTPSSRDDTADEPLASGEPIVVATAPRGPEGYHGGLVRTFVVDAEGGQERRVHVGVTQSLRSAAAMVTAGTESVTAVEGDLEAEVRAFGVDETDTVETTVAGVGLEPHERPLEGSDEIEPGSVVRVESAVHADDVGWIRLAELLVKGRGDDPGNYLEAPSRSLVPAAVLEE